MTKKDYILIAGQLADAMTFARNADNNKNANDESSRIMRITIINLCKVFWLENNRFDYKKFMQACGIKDIPENLTF